MKQKMLKKLRVL